MWTPSLDLGGIRHLWDEQERRLSARPYHLTSVAELPDALVANWEQISAAMFQNPVSIYIWPCSVLV